jgi:hypothetical protein
MRDLLLNHHLDHCGPRAILAPPTPYTLPESTILTTIVAKGQTMLIKHNRETLVDDAGAVPMRYSTEPGRICMICFTEAGTYQVYLNEDEINRLAHYLQRMKIEQAEETVAQDAINVVILENFTAPRQ